jgi:hypothetical protein
MILILILVILLLSGGGGYYWGPRSGVSLLGLFLIILLVLWLAGALGAPPNFGHVR